MRMCRGGRVTGVCAFGDSGPRRRCTVPAAAKRWAGEDVARAARLAFLLAGVSYYKTAAPPVIDLGGTAVTDTERAFLRSFYLDGLAEFGYRNALDLSGLRIEGPSRPGGAPAPVPPPRPRRPLVPFGGGLDPVPTTEMI